MASCLLIIPCYNEAKRLNVSAFKGFLKSQKQVDLVFADDGSEDATPNILNDFAQSSSRVRYFRFERNEGKAEAIRKTVLKLLDSGESFDWVGFADADLAVPLAEVLTLLAIAEQKQVVIAAGARVMLAGHRIRRNIWRHYFSRIFTTFYANLLDLHNYDTQCGLKFFHKEMLPIIFGEKFLTKWMFDIEIFVRAKKSLGQTGYEQKVLEIPVQQWEERAGSKLKWTDFLRAPFEVMKIRNFYY